MWANFKSSYSKKRIEYFKSFVGEEEPKDKCLLKTINMPKNLLFSSDKLPKSNYDKQFNTIKYNDENKNFRSINKGENYNKEEFESKDFSKGIHIKKPQELAPLSNAYEKKLIKNNKNDNLNENNKQLNSNSIINDSHNLNNITKEKSDNINNSNFSNNLGSKSLNNNPNNSNSSTINDEDINELKKQNLNLRNEIKELKDKLNKEKDKNQKLTLKLEELTNILNKEKNYLSTQKEMTEKITELENYNKKIEKLLSIFPFKISEDDKIISIIFITSDENIHYSMICKSKEMFIDLEKRLYINYPQYKETKNYYYANGYKIDVNKTLEDNKIKDNEIIIISHENDNDNI